MVFIIQEIPVAKILSLQLSSAFQTCCKNFGMNLKSPVCDFMCEY